MVREDIQDRKLGTLQSEADIQRLIIAQRESIAPDIDRAIDDFINNGNKHHATKILKAIEATGKPQEAFAAWREYAIKGDDTLLSQRIRALGQPSLDKMFDLHKATTKFEQRQQEQPVDAPRERITRGLRAAFRTVAGRLSKAEHRGGFTEEQNAIYETFWMARWMFDGPNTDIHPLTQILAPHFKAAAQEKLMTSLSNLRAASGSPLIDESLIYSLRDDVVKEALARYDRLAEQSYGPQNPPMKHYGFTSKQMADVTFGVEFEGFTAFAEKYPDNVHALAEALNDTGLAASAAMTAKEDDGYATWKVTYDGSIVSPQDYIGRHKTHDLVVAESYGVEVVSPVLDGVRGHAQMKKAIDALRSVTFRSNETCGMHMHVGIKETTLEQKKNLAHALYNNQDALDTLISPERHGDNNKFAVSISKIDPAAIDAATTTEELVKAVNPNHRYYKFSFKGLVTPGAPPTVEYRGAGGAAYLEAAEDYAVILGNFTQQALDNPDIKLAEVISRLEQQRDAKATMRMPAAPARQPLKM